MSTFADRLLAIDLERARQAARLGELTHKQPVTLPDLLIAATAARHRLIVLTRNVGEFKRLSVPVRDAFVDCQWTSKLQSIVGQSLLLWGGRGPMWLGATAAPAASAGGDRDRKGCQIAQTRAFCYVEDLIDGLVRLMMSPDLITGPINLGNPEEFTILQLASTIIDLTGSASGIVHKPLPQDDPRQRRPDITKAAELLEWKPTTPLREGLVF